VARLLAAETETTAAHRLEHVAVADRGPHEANAGALERGFDAHVRHHRADRNAMRKLVPPGEIARDDQHHRVPVEDRAGLVDQQHAIGIAVEGDADDRTGRARDLLAHPCLQHAQVGRAAGHVDAAAVVVGVDRHDARTEPFEDLSGPTR